ncbi:D-amino-acid transaminase [Cohnella candidum]|uniref:D-alanine aminotransferase n=1 Tax=Cohnella candidum TaxID=2674991 RepID=A0A3G3JXH3_9BACL|nr:D-amino-acid transaminase [Cohnella candidum]AYQ72914.1 D-amino-acid transaminase [Cohnella candidum]
MAPIYWYQDRWLPAEEVRISPDDRGYYFGDGVYEVFRVYGGALFEADAHLARLQASADGIRIRLPHDLETLKSRLEELVRRNGLQEGTVYLQVTRGTAPRAHLFPPAAEPVTLAYCTEVKRPLAAMQAGCAAVTAEDIRWLHCNYKTLNLLANVLAKQDAADRGAADAILHRGGIVTESSASNVMIVSDGKLVTHPANNLILHGITRAVVLRLAHASAIPVEERPFTLAELRAADEAFLTGTTIEILPVISVDGSPVGAGKPGPVTRQLQEQFERAILF